MRRIETANSMKPKNQRTRPIMSWHDCNVSSPLFTLPDLHKKVAEDPDLNCIKKPSPDSPNSSTYIDLTQPYGTKNTFG